MYVRSFHCAPYGASSGQTTRLVVTKPSSAIISSAAVALASLLSACGGSDGPNGAELDAAARPQANAFAQYSRPDTFGALLQADLLVPVRDGYRLTCNLHRPAAADGSPAPGKFPSILANFTGYGRTNKPFGNAVTDFSKKGYTILVCNTRGSQGTAGGSPSQPESVTQVNPFSPQEAQDNYDVIEWIATQPWSTGRVGQIGTSYGGITSMSAAGSAPPSLKAVIPVLATHDIYRYFFTDGGIRTAVTGDARGSWATICSIFTGESTCSARLPAEWNAHPVYDAYWAARTVDLNAVKVPVLFVSGMNDFWMGAQDARWQVMNKRDNVATVIGPWNHNIPELGGTEPYSQARPEMTNMYLAWFDRWVAELAAAPLPPKAIVQGIQAAGTSNWDGFAAWPPKGSEDQLFYLTSSGMQKGTPGTGSLSFAVASDGTTAGLTLRSEPFATTTTLAGPVEVKLPLSFSASDANLIANIKSESANGTITDLGYGAYQKASHLESDASPSSRVSGRSYQYTMRVPSKYWTFAAGDRMVLTVTSSDKFVVSDSPAGTVTVALGMDASVRAPMLPR
ncbi:CocE/NonD family hydrolase [Sphingobium xenophagum]|uniref:Xaa-Pro dipeptidyl-peptidase C-terminal domain-containing protein n=1 Tax=Sphingobium xenophagum TaxID=121428 RepID=A0A401J8T8_SPHXE|nr:CocE/NonD family hydrolase [Sphingobium xenophagum]GBH33057.1 hypothetical protein MBESOW_P4222 [Sphingobium xenophagum]